MLELDAGTLASVCGGLPPAQPAPKQQEPKTWIDRLDQNLNKRGYDPHIDPKMEHKPSNPTMDPGIIRPWSPFVPQARERSA